MHEETRKKNMRQPNNSIGEPANGPEFYYVEGYYLTLRLSRGLFEKEKADVLCPVLSPLD